MPVEIMAQLGNESNVSKRILSKKDFLSYLISGLGWRTSVDTLLLLTFFCKDWNLGDNLNVGLKLFLLLLSETFGGVTCLRVVIVVSEDSAAQPDFEEQSAHSRDAYDSSYWQNLSSLAFVEFPSEFDFISHEKHK